MPQLLTGRFGNLQLLLESGSRLLVLRFGALADLVYHTVLLDLGAGVVDIVQLVDGQGV